MDMDAIKSGLANLKKNQPAKEKKTKKELIKELAKDIKELRESGYSFDDILKVIENGGVTIKESTLKKYLTSATNTKKKSVKNDKTNSIKNPVVHSSAAEAASSYAQQGDTPAPPRHLKKPGRADGSFAVSDDDA